MTNKLEVINIAKSYSSRRILKKVSLTLNRGECIGLLGANGAGKTSLFYIICGLIKHDKGKIKLDGKNITNLPMYRRAKYGMGYLPQEASIFRGLSVEDNIKAILELYVKDNDKLNNKLDELLADFAITHIRKCAAQHLSGGERRRVEIARCLASFPKYVLLDEPLAGIDPIAIADIKKLIMQLKSKGLGVLITDHNVQEALSIIDRAYIIHDGNIIKEGTPKEIISNDDVRKVYLGQEFSLRYS